MSKAVILSDVNLYGGIRTTFNSNVRVVRSTITAYQCGTCTTLGSVQLVSKAVILSDVTLYGGIRTTLHSNDRVARVKIFEYRSGTCTTLEAVSNRRAILKNGFRSCFFFGKI